MAYIDGERLILNVQRHRCLYDINFDDYSDKDRKDSAWQSVCEETCDDWDGLDPIAKEIRRKDIKKKWSNIRDYYRKVKSGSLIDKRKKYVHGPLLTFLDFARGLEDGGDHFNRIEDRTVELLEGEVKLENSFLKESNSSAQTVKKENKTKKISRVFRNAQSDQDSDKDMQDSDNIAIGSKKEKKDNIERELVDCLKNLMNQPRDDPDAMFLLSFASDMKLLSPVQKIDFKLGILQLLKNIKYPLQTHLNSS